MTDTVIKTTELDTVVVNGSDTVSIITQGIQGPPGVSGIGGYEAEIVDPEAGDLITFSATKWINIKRVEVSDGGNF